jgi:hypothetical protein
VRNKRQLKIHIHNEDDEDDDYYGQNKDIETIVREDLPLSGTLVDGPEIFKRVKFLSRWEDRSESRGELYRTFGYIHLWTLCCHGVAEMARFQMVVSIHIQWNLYRDWVLAGLLPDEIEGWFVAAFIGFVGRSREQSLPVLIGISTSKRLRRRLFKVLKRLDWLGTHSRFSVLTAPPSVFGDKWWVEESFRRYRTPGSHEFKTRMEAQKRLELLKNHHLYE